VRHAIVPEANRRSFKVHQPDLVFWKSKARISNFETNPKERKFKDESSNAPDSKGFKNSNLWSSPLFRISIFEFRIWLPRAETKLVEKRV
jgi:hypothetical protein